MFRLGAARGFSLCWRPPLARYEMGPPASRWLPNIAGMGAGAECCFGGTEENQPISEHGCAARALSRKPTNSETRSADPGALRHNTHTPAPLPPPQPALRDPGEMKINGVGKVISSESHFC